MNLEKLLKKERDNFLMRTPRSEEVYNTAKQYVAGAVSRSPLYYDPYPIFIKEGKGYTIRDVDGNDYIDYINNYTSNILGHAHPVIIQAVKDAVEKGVSFNGPIEEEYILSKLITERLHSVDQLRFTNSGTEAVMYAIKTARAITGRSKIAKFEGAFHGGYDSVQVSVKIVPEKCGSKEAPIGCASKGVTTAVSNETIILPFNNSAACKEIIWREKEELAAVIIDPIMSVPGLIIPTKEFMTKLREITEECNVLLIFDEVVSFRIGTGGAQEYYNIMPDLTVLGKIIGGGFPVGAFGGKEEIMQSFNPPQYSGYLVHGGTFNANPITLTAGINTINFLDKNLCDHLNTLGETLRKGVRNLFKLNDLEGQITGISSLFNFHFSKEPIVDYRSTFSDNQKFMQYIFWGLMNRGIFLAPRGYGCISAPMTGKNVQTFLETLSELIDVYKA